MKALGRAEATRILYSAIARGERPRLSGEALETLVETAALNKVLLHALRVLGVEGPIREREERRLKTVIEDVASVARALKGLDHAFFKLVKPITYVPADIDVLIDSDGLREAVARLRMAGYRVEVAESYCLTMIKGGSIVDLYIHPSVGGVVYADGRLLLEHRRETDYHGVEITSLERHAEAVMAAAHAVYKEGIYTLNDMITVEAWLGRRGLRLAAEIRCSTAVKYALSVHETFRRGQPLPHKVPLARWLALLGGKLVGDGLTRATAGEAIRYLASKRIGRMVMSRAVRVSY